MNIKEVRKKLNVTQEQFAKMLNVTINTVINWERTGKVPDSMQLLIDYVCKDKSVDVNNGIIGIGNSNNNIDNRQYYSDSPDVLRKEIDLLDERIKEKDAQIKEKDAQIKEKDAQIKTLLEILKQR